MLCIFITLLVQELGLRVVEVNVGNKAKGTTIEALVGEAMQSSAVQSQQVVLHRARPPTHPPTLSLSSPIFCVV